MAITVRTAMSEANSAVRVQVTNAGPCPVRSRAEAPTSTVPAVVNLANVNVDSCGSQVPTFSLYACGSQTPIAFDAFGRAWAINSNQGMIASCILRVQWVPPTEPVGLTIYGPNSLTQRPEQTGPGFVAWRTNESGGGSFGLNVRFLDAQSVPATPIVLVPPTTTTTTLTPSPTSATVGPTPSTTSATIPFARITSTTATPPATTANTATTASSIRSTPPITAGKGEAPAYTGISIGAPVVAALLFVAAGLFLSRLRRMGRPF